MSDSSLGVQRPSHRPCVLVVDDQLDMREFLRDVFESEFDVVTAHHGRAAMRLIEQEGVRPDVAVVDMLMPEKDGNETIRDLRAADPNMRIVAMSGGGRAVGLECLEVAEFLGADSVLKKPLDAAVALDVIRALTR